MGRRSVAVDVVVVVGRRRIPIGTWRRWSQAPGQQRISLMTLALASCIRCR